MLQSYAFKFITNNGLSFTQEVNPRLVKRPLKTNGRLANLGLTSFAKQATEHPGDNELTIVIWHYQVMPYW